MAIKVQCSCGQFFQAKDELAGKRVKCPKCGSALQIPSPQATASGGNLGLEQLLAEAQARGPSPLQQPQTSTTGFTPYQGPVTPYQMGAPVSAQRGSNKTLLWVLAGGGAVVVLAVAFIVIWFITRGPSDNVAQGPGSSGPTSSGANSGTGSGGTTTQSGSANTDPSALLGPKTFIFSDDGQFIIASLTNFQKKPVTSSMGVWDTSTLKKVRELESPHASSSLAISPDGKLIASVGKKEKEEEFKVWDLATGKVTLQKEMSRADSVGFTADGKYAYCMRHNRGVSAVNLESGAVEDIKGHLPSPFSAAFSPTSDSFVTYIYADHLEVYDMSSRNLTHTRQIGHSAVSLAIARDGKTLAAANDQNLTVAGLPELQPLVSIPTKFGFQVDEFAISPDGRYVALGAGDRVAIWDVQTKQERTLKVAGFCEHLVFSGGGELVVSTDDKPLTYFDPSSGATVAQLRKPPPVERPQPPPDVAKLSPPTVPPKAALHLYFKLRTASGRTGTSTHVTGFAIRWPGERRPILVTSLDPFSHESIGAQADAIGRTVTGVAVHNPEGGERWASGGDALPIKGAFTSSGKLEGDMAAFWGDADAEIGALTLSETPAKRHDPAWLLRLPVEGESAAPRLLPALVERIEKGVIVIELQTQDEIPKWGGAPLLNAQGQVIGMYAVNVSAKGGMGITSARVRELIAEAIGK